VIEAEKDSPAQQPSQVDILREINQGGTGEYNIILTARPRGSLPTALWNCSYFVFVGDEMASTV
jgi:hypothetical protein